MNLKNKFTENNESERLAPIRIKELSQSLKTEVMKNDEVIYAAWLNANEIFALLMQHPLNGHDDRGRFETLIKSEKLSKDQISTIAEKCEHASSVSYMQRVFATKKLSCEQMMTYVKKEKCQWLTKTAIETGLFPDDSRMELEKLKLLFESERRESSRKAAFGGIDHC